MFVLWPENYSSNSKLRPDSKSKVELKLNLNEILPVTVNF